MKITNRNISSIIACIILFFVLFTISHFFLENISNDTLRHFSINIVSTIATVLLGNVLWEIIAKENFAASLLKQVKMSENIAKSGIDAVYIDFRNIDWASEFKATKSFCAAFTYAYSWRSHNDIYIKEFAAKNSRRKKSFIIVPDPDQKDIMSDLDHRFNFESGKTKALIEDCIKYFHDLHITVYLFEGTLQSSYYMMDNHAIMSFFTHSKQKATVPALKANRSGNMYKYIANDIDSLKARSHRVTSISIELVNGDRVVKIGRDPDGEQ